MAFKGTAGKSSSGASMSKYDVEVEARLKKLEAKVSEISVIEAMVSSLERSVDELKAHSHPDRGGSTGDGDVESKLERLVAVLKQTPSLGLDQYDDA